MILFEGSDCVGKTTVAMELRRLLPGWSYRYYTRPPASIPPFHYHFWGLSDSHSRILLDRLHWSGYAYGKTYRAQPDYSVEEWRKAELILLTHNCHVVYMTDSTENIRERWRATQANQMFSSDPLHTLLNHFNDLVHKKSIPASVLPAHTYTLPELWDLQKKQPTQQMRELAAAESNACRMTNDMLPPSVGVGSPMARFAILGESPRDQQEVKNDGPQVPLFGGKAMDWLWSAFDNMGLYWWRGYYTNVSAFDTPASLGRYFSETVPVNTILCLGTRALNTAKAAYKQRALAPHVQVEGVVHPSYARRFEHGEFLGYCRNIYAVLQEWCSDEEPR